jgi:hypothetical protein
MFTLLKLVLLVLAIKGFMVFDNTDFINSTIRKYARGGFLDNVSKRVPTFNWMRTKGCLAYWDGSGTKFTEEVIKELPSYMQAIGPYEEIIAKPFNGTALVDFPTKELVWPLTFTTKELEGNMSKEKMIDLLKTRMKVVELGAAQDIEQMILSDGTAQGGKVMLGLEAFIPDTQTSGTLCGFTKSTTSWIQCPSVSGAKTSVAFDNLRLRMSSQTNTMTYGTVRPEIYLTTSTVYEGYETLAYGKWTPTTKEAYDLGFNGDMTFRGKPVAFGDYISAGRMYILNSESLKLRVNGLKNSKDSPFAIEGPWDLRPRQKVKQWLISVNGCLTGNLFRQMGKIHSIT